MKSVLNIGFMLAVAGMTYIITKRSLAAHCTEMPYSPNPDTYANPEY
jgi:hypothetical protein